MSELLLIIGAGLEQIPAYKRAREMGCRVVGTDMDPNAPAFAYADYKLIASTRNVDETCSVVSDFAKSHKIDGVMTIANDVPHTVAKVAELLSLAGVDPAAVVRLTDKSVMKQCFMNAGVDTPAFVEIDTFDVLLAEQTRFGREFILKPSDGRGAKGVLLVSEDIDIRWAYDHAMSYCDNGRLILEEYVPGPQLSVEGMFIDGTYMVAAYADRNYDNLSETRPYIVEDGGTLPSRFEGNILETMRKTIERGAKSVGITSGPIKADIVLRHDSTPSIIELAGRLSGNYLATHHIPYAYGIDLVGTIIDLSLGHEIERERLAPTCRKYLGVRYFFPKAGKITDISGLEALSQNPHVYDYAIYPAAGDEQPDISHHGARAGTVMAMGDTYETATKNAIEAVESVTFHID